jgi:hypothetical protein
MQALFSFIPCAFPWLIHLRLSTRWCIQIESDILHLFNTTINAYKTMWNINTVNKTVSNVSRNVTEQNICNLSSSDLWDCILVCYSLQITRVYFMFSSTYYKNKIKFITLLYWEPGSSVSIVSDYGLDDWAIEVGCWQRQRGFSL